MAMQRCAVPVDLVRAARIVVGSVARNVANDGSGVYSALLASQLYETIKNELARTPRQAAATVGVLSAALDQCRNAAVHVDAPDLMEGELRAALETLERAMQTGAAARIATPPRFTVIEGGLSAAASR
jgi:S-adenosylmethionine:diacylglycerol 3-amino-3-carboxypropyl transferase